MKFEDIIKNINHSDIKLTKFLNLSEQAQVKNHLKYADFQLIGGYQNPEYKRLLLNTNDPEITCFKIIYNKNFLTLTHSNILGTFLSKGLERNTIGDILAEDDIFFCISEIKEYLLQEFTMISNTKVSLQEIDGTDYKRTINLQEDKTFIDSMRLDLVVSKIANISRDKAKYFILNDFVKVNHLITLKPTKTIKEEDIISIRKYGRFQIIDTKKRSKKNKIILIYGKFI